MIKKTVAPSLSLILFLITCAIFTVHNYLYYSIIPTYEKQLSSIAHNHAQEINTFLNQQEKNGIQLSQEPAVINALMNKDETQPVTTLIQSHQENMLFKHILLIDPTGTVIFSTTKKNIVGEHINQSPHTNSSLGKSYERAMMTLTNDFSNFNFNELFQEPALFITIPILKEKKIVGALSYQLDEEKIYLITNQYINLEKTGEVVLAKKEGAYAIFLSPTRNDPDLAFKKTALFTKTPPAIQPAVVGQEGAGKAVDYRDKKIVGAWKFIPKLDWGMIVKIDYDEIVNPTNTTKKLLLIFCILFIISLCFTIYVFFPLIRHTIKTINAMPPCNKLPSWCKKPLFILFLLFLSLSLKNIIQCERKKLSSIEKAKNQAIEKTTQNAESIETALSKMAFVGQSIADDLRTHYLAKEDIATRIQRDLTENRLITNITILFMPSAYDQTAEFHAETISHDTPDHAAVQTAQAVILSTTKWYTQALQHGSTWVINHPQETQKKYPTTTYACTFFDHNNQPQGVIAITYSLDTIIRTAEFSGIGQTGYSIIMDNSGTFIFHPIHTLVHTKTTLLQYAQENGNEELAAIAEKISADKPCMASYSSESGNELFWIYTYPIKINNWTICSLFSQDEIGLSAHKIRHYYFWILIWITITVLLLCALLWQCNIISFTCYAVIANIILFMALVIAWHVIQTTTTIDRETRTIITDQSNLNKFLNDLHDEAQRKHQAPPINIPCGILISSISPTDHDHIAISGYLWNKYDSTQQNLGRGMQLPQASKMNFTNPTTVVSDHEETITWNIQGVLFQEQHYTKYPFDQQQIRIILEHKDLEKNTLMVPDLDSYKKISPESLPGLDKEFIQPGFTIEQTFFEYHKVEPTTNFGLQDFGKVTDNYQLVYNAIMNRDLLNPFVLYLLPLLVILFTLFSTLLVEGIKSEPLSILGGYTGLFFALIVLQRSLREQYPAGSTLYLEYAFFYTYITILLLIIHTILMYYYKRWESYQNKSLYFMRILFWPFQLVSWLITTLIVFY